MSLYYFPVVLLYAGVGIAGPSSRTLGPCQTCKILVASFQNGLERMEHSNSGHTENGTTPTSHASTPGPLGVGVPEGAKDKDARYDGILKTLCSDVKMGKEQCMELAGSHSAVLEEYWEKEVVTSHAFLPPSQDHLHSWLCVQRLQLCCPPNHYGGECRPCKGYPNLICSGHGKCKGNGTRKGNGGCLCDRGYIGEDCNACGKLYYEAYRDSTKLICSPCHRGCAGGCKGAGAKSCNGCNDGWEMDEEMGCMDVNECIMFEEPCGENEFCINGEGSFSCFECDKSCSGCTGDGPDMCESCAEGYSLIDKLCIDNRSRTGRDRRVDIARYLTYFGLCVSTCIIFQKNMGVAGVIGVAVGMYIGTSEYLLSAEEHNNSVA